MFYIGPGSFFPGIFFLLGHIILMILIHAYTVHKYTKTNIQDKDMTFYVRLLYVSLINGLANAFIYNFVHVTLDTQESLGNCKGMVFSLVKILSVLLLDT